MSKDSVTNNQLYTAIMSVHQKIDDIVEKRITPLERLVDKLVMYASAGILVISFIFSGLWEIVKIRFFKSV